MRPFDSNNARKILIIMMGGIGNMIFMTPALKAMRKALPSAEFVFLLGPFGAEKVLEASFLIDRKIVAGPETHSGLPGFLRLIRKLRQERFSLSIASTGTNPVKSGLLCLLAGIRNRVGENIGGKGFFYNIKVPFDRQNHEVEGNIRLLKTLGISVDDRTLFIQRTEEARRAAREFFSQENLEGRTVIGIHPGSGIHQAGFKRWPKERFAALADRLSQEFGARVILFGGAEEISLAAEIRRAMKSAPLIMTGKSTLSQTASLIAKCRLFISNDSGLLHVACAVATPAIGIFGPTSPLRTGPFHSCSSVIRKELRCSPCYRGKPVSCSHRKCLEEITVEDVFEEAKRLLEEHGA